MRRAEWRRRADDPKNLVGWWWRGAIENRFVGIQFILSIVGSCFLLRNVGAGFLWVSASCFVGALASKLKRPNRLSELLPDLPPLGEFRARVSYHRDGMTTGTDEMALVVIDGWLIGEGVRSHFALRPEDVPTSWVPSDGARAFAATQGADYGAKRAIRLRLSDGGEIRLRGLEAAAFESVRTWMQADSPKGEPTFPPAHPHPQALVPWAFWSYGASAGIFLPLFIASWLHLGGGFSEVRIAFMLMICGASRLLWRQIGRLEKIGRRADWEDDRNALESETRLSLWPPLGMGDDSR